MDVFCLTQAEFAATYKNGFCKQRGSADHWRDLASLRCDLLPIDTIFYGRVRLAGKFISQRSSQGMV